MTFESGVAYPRLMWVSLFPVLGTKLSYQLIGPLHVILRLPEDGPETLILLKSFITKKVACLQTTSYVYNH